MMGLTAQAGDIPASPAYLSFVSKSPALDCVHGILHRYTRFNMGSLRTEKDWAMVSSVSPRFGYRYAIRGPQVTVQKTVEAIQAVIQKASPDKRIEDQMADYVFWQAHRPLKDESPEQIRIVFTNGDNGVDDVAAFKASHVKWGAYRDARDVAEADFWQPYIGTDCGPTDEDYDQFMQSQPKPPEEWVSLKRALQPLADQAVEAQTILNALAHRVPEFNPFTGQLHYEPRNHPWKDD